MTCEPGVVILGIFFVAQLFDPGWTHLTFHTLRECDTWQVVVISSWRSGFFFLWDLILLFSDASLVWHFGAVTHPSFSTCYSLAVTILRHVPKKYLPPTTPPVTLTFFRALRYWPRMGFSHKSKFTTLSTCTITTTTTVKLLHSDFRLSLGYGSRISCRTVFVLELFWAPRQSPHPSCRCQPRARPSFGKHFQLCCCTTYLSTS